MYLVIVVEEIQVVYIEMTEFIIVEFRIFAIRFVNKVSLFSIFLFCSPFSFAFCLNFITLKFFLIDS